MISFEAFKERYERLWSSLIIRSTAEAEATRLADELFSGKAKYEEIQSRTGVPWWFIGLCHYRESDFNFKTYLGNGQSLNRPTTIVPKGRGPFTGPNAFVEGAIDALRCEHFIGAQDWTIARVLYRLEGFNGYGYHAQGVNSPYLWGGSTAYGPPESRAGKYVRDHVFDPNVVDKQFGTAVVLKALMAIDPTISFGAAVAFEPNAPREPDDEAADSILWVQRTLNRLGATPSLTEDGRNGPKTMAAVSAFQQRNGLDDTGLGDAQTVAALQSTLQPASPSSGDAALRMRVSSLEQQLAAAIRQSAPATPTIPAAPVTPVPNADAVDVSAVLRQILGALTQATAPGSTPPDLPLGEVNGALGATIGELLNGKKTAIGITGALVTQILSQVPAGSGLGQVLALITPAAGLSPYTMPIFLALTAWGVLGKFEKWSQQSNVVAAKDATAVAQAVKGTP